MSDNLTNQELCILLESIRALLQTGNSERAEEIITNAIQRIDNNFYIVFLYTIHNLHFHNFHLIFQQVQQSLYLSTEI